MDTSGPDFIVSELLSELKEENKRKDQQIKALQTVVLRVVVSCVAAVLIVIGICFWYLSLYDFSGTEEYTTEKNAKGVVAVIDSDGNVIGYDSSEEVETDGGSESSYH